MKKELIKEKNNYTLFIDDNNNYVISVIVSSGILLYELNIMLNMEEKQRFLEDGKDYINRLARDIGYYPEKYQERDLA